MDSSTEQSVPAASSIRSWNAETFNNWFYDPQWQGNASLSHSFSVMNPVQLNLIFLKGKRWCSIYRSWALCRRYMTVASVVYRCGCTRTAGGPTDATGVVSGRIRRNQRRRVNGRTAFSPTLGSATADIHWPNW